MKFIDGFTNVFLDPGHTIMHPDRTITDRHFYEAVNYGRTIQILHKNYEIVINELLLHFRIVNSLIGMTNISTLSSTLLYKHILGSVIKIHMKGRIVPGRLVKPFFECVNLSSQQPTIRITFGNIFFACISCLA